jgi:hypothetical protein
VLSALGGAPSASASRASSKVTSVTGARRETFEEFAEREWREFHAAFNAKVQRRVAAVVREARRAGRQVDRRAVAEEVKRQFDAEAIAALDQLEPWPPPPPGAPGALAPALVTSSDEDAA